MAVFQDKWLMSMAFNLQIHPEYRLYGCKKISSTLSNLQKTYDECGLHAEIDQEAFEKYWKKHQLSLFPTKKATQNGKVLKREAFKSLILRQASIRG
jgi:hypothetical protein